MFPGAQPLHPHSTVQPTNGGSTTRIVKIERVLSVLELFGGVTIALFLAGVVVPSLLRSGIGHRTWRLVHLTSYAAWPLAVLHSMGTGTDSTAGWLWVIYAACIVTVAASLAWRVHARREMQLQIERALPAPPETGWR